MGQVSEVELAISEERDETLSSFQVRIVALEGSMHACLQTSEACTRVYTHPKYARGFAQTHIVCIESHSAASIVTVHQVNLCDYCIIRTFVLLQYKTYVCVITVQDVRLCDYRTIITFV